MVLTFLKILCIWSQSINKFIKYLENKNKHHTPSHN